MLYHAISLAAESPLLRYPTCTLKKTKCRIKVAGSRLNTWNTVNDDDDDDDDDDSSALANTRP